MRLDRDRRRSEPSGTTYEHNMHDPRSPARLARDLLQVVQETVFSKKFEESPKRCPLVREESDLTSSDEEDGIERRIANLIDFFFTIVKSQKDERKSSGGSCFKSECSPTDAKIQPYMPTKVNTELEQKMETLIEYLATTGCMDKEEQNSDKEDKKITLMEFLFGPDDGKSWPEKPLIEINSEPNRGLSLSESNIHFKGLTFIDETPEEESNETLVEILLKYMENYSSMDKLKEPTKSISVTPPSLSEKSKSDVTISRLETYSDMSKTKSDSTLTQTQDTVIDRYDDKSCGSRRISETVVDLSYVKQDLEGIFEEAAVKVREYNVDCIDDIMTEQEDVENFNAYTKPPSLQYYTEYLPYSVELSDIMEEDEPSSRGLERKSSDNERMSIIRFCAEELIKFIEEKIQSYPFEKDGDDSSEEYSREFDVSPSLKRSSISLIDLRNIPDLPPSMMMKPQVVRVDKSTSTTEISDSVSDMSKRIDSACMTEDTTLTSSSERNERAIDKLESLHRFFSKSRLEIIDESLEEHVDKKSPKEAAPASESTSDNIDQKVGQASLDDVDDLQDDNDLEKKGDDSGWDEFVAEMDEKCTTADIGCETVDFPESGEKAACLNKTKPIVMNEKNVDYENTYATQHCEDSKMEDGSMANR